MPRSKERVRVSPPKSKRCGSRGKGRGRYTKAQLVALAKASGVNPRQIIDDLCEELGIQPPVDSVEIPKKKCGSKERGDDRYTREEVRVLAKYRKIKITGKTMDQLCDELGITLEDSPPPYSRQATPPSPPPYSSGQAVPPSPLAYSSPESKKERWKILFQDEKIQDLDRFEKLREWEKEPDTLILYYGDDTMLVGVDYSMFPAVNRLLQIPNAAMIPLNREDIDEIFNQLVTKISIGKYKRVRMLNADPQINGMGYRLFPGQREQLGKMLQKLQRTTFK